MYERRRCLRFLSLGFIPEHTFGPKNNLSCPVFVFRRGMSNSISDRVLYPKSEGVNIS